MPTSIGERIKSVLKPDKQTLLTHSVVVNVAVAMVLADVTSVKGDVVRFARINFICQLFSSKQTEARYKTTLGYIIARQGY